MPANIVLILVDDADAKVLEHAACSRIRDALLDEGATATRYLTSHPLCAPARASILRGMYAQNTGVNGNPGAYAAFDDNGGLDSNIARWLKAAETPYRTGMIGKFINGYNPNVEGRPDMGFDYWFGVGKGGYNGFDYDAWDDYKPNGAGVRHYGTEQQGVENYLTTVLTSKALQFLADPAETTEPFFLMITPMAPHGPSTPHPDHVGDYDSASYPKGAMDNASFNEDDVSDKPYYISMIEPLDQQRINAIDTRYRRRLECMLSVADLVDAVIGKLEELEVLDNTYVFFTSDHGFHMGEHRLGNEISQDDADGTSPGGKNSMYEEDIRVPLWIRHHSITVDTIDQLVGNVDLAPTFRDIAGLNPTPADPVIDGRSFLPLLTGQSIQWRTQYLISRGQNKPYWGFRHTDEWVFGQLLTPAPYEVEGEYYENLDDQLIGQFQLDNGYLALAAENPPDRLEELQDLTYAYRQCAGDSCRVYDSQVI